MRLAVPGRLAWVWVASGILGIVGGVGGAVVGWAAVSASADAAVTTSDEAAAALESVVELTSSLDGTLASVTDALRDVQITVADGSVRLTQLAAATGDLADVVSSDVPRAVDGVVDALPSLVATAGVVDTTMRTLSLIGVDYTPDEALDDALVRIQDELAVIPPRLRAQSGRLEAAADGLSSFSSSALDVSTQIAGIRAALAEAGRLVGTVEASSREAVNVARDMASRIPRQAVLFEAVVVVLGGFVAGTATLPLFLGRKALVEARSPDGHEGDGAVPPAST
jgi:hypothetical protein